MLEEQSNFEKTFPLETYRFLKGKKVLITGVGGFMGSRLAFVLHRLGALPYGTSRNAEKTLQNMPFLAGVFSWRWEEEFPKEALQGMDLVVHLAGENVGQKRWTSKRKQEIWSSRTVGLKRLLSSLQKESKTNILRLLVASAIGYYGNRGEEWVDESSAAGKGFLAEICKKVEQDTHKAFPEAQCLRLGMVVGRGGALEKMLPVFQKGLGGKLGKGDQWISWIHLDDAIRLILLWAEEKKPPKVVLGVSPFPLRNAEWSEVLAKKLGKKLFLGPPAWVLKLLLGEMTEELLLGSLRARASQKETWFLYPRLEEALQAILKEEPDQRNALEKNTR